MSKPIIIEAGKNKQKGWYFPLCFSSFTMTLSFDESWEYDSGDQQSDLHKVCGIAIFHLFKSFSTTKHKKWWELHKWLSVRLGARWNKVERVMEITDYTYIDGIGERDTTDNIIVKVKIKEVFKVTPYVEKNILGIYIETKDKHYIIEKSCKTPIFLCIPFFLRLRAYVGSGFTTLKNMIINRYD
jgi:hypothetical protein